MGKHCFGRLELVDEPLFKSACSDLLSIRDVGSLDQRKSSPDYASEYRGAVGVFRPEVRLDTDHADRLQPSL